jgi:HAD superfamily hydrolase (TIGR01490 family)
MTKLAVFDFDGTLYKGDSMRDFAKFLNPKQYYVSLIKLVVPYLKYVSGQLQRDDLKAAFLRLNFTGYPESELFEKGRAFAKGRLNRCYKTAVRWIAQEQNEGTRILILSGSCTPWLQPFADHFNADLICTELEFENGASTGKWKGKNMTGHTKKEALAKYLEQQETINYTLSFGDRNSDALAGALADEYHQNYFHS